MMTLVVLLLICAAGLGGWLARSVLQPLAPWVSADESARPAQRPAAGAHAEEIAAALLRLSPLERSTLQHLRTQNLQTFIADRDSPLLRWLSAQGLLHPMGSSAYPPDRYPYRVPDVVWNQLAPSASRADPASPHPAPRP